MLLHANPVNVADGLRDGVAVAAADAPAFGTGGGHMPASVARGPPPTFRTTAKPTPAPADARGQSLALPVPTNTGRPKLAPINGGTGPAPLADPGSSSSKPQAPLPPSGPQAPSPNPAEATTYQTSHHALVPRTRVKHSHSARAARAPPTGATAAALQRLGLGPDDATATGRRSGLSVAALGLAAGGDGGAALLPGRVGIGPGAWGGASSVGDLEALDAILDQLVVLDVRMRQALLRGPLVSFETVVSESAARQGLVTDIPGEGDAAARDRTFLTSVRGVVEEAPEEEEEEAAAEASSGQQPQQRGQQQQQSLPSIPGAGDAAGVLDHMRQGGAPHNHHGGEDVFGGPGGEAGLPEAPGNADALRGAMPVPILPKLARMYITSKAATACKAPPPAPPTAQWLLRSRLPVPTSEAPTYDTLVTQIKDVQRQYTCGTARDKATLAAEAARGGGMLGGGGGMGGMAGQHARTALDAYISGIDGPPLADVVAPQLAPSVTERSRPTFVSMKRAAPSHTRPLSSSPGVSRSPRSQSPTRGPSPPRPQHASSLGAGGPHVAGHHDAPMAAPQLEGAQATAA